MDEKDALRITLEHVRRYWLHRSGQEANEGDVLAILKLMNVAILDLEQDGTDRREALNLIALGIAAQRGQESAIWSTLETYAADLSQKRSGADLTQVRQTLSIAGMALRALPSYEGDINKLRELSNAAVAQLAHNSRIPFRTQTLRIEREVSKTLAD